jgi:hypothetical protein
MEETEWVDKLIVPILSNGMGCCPRDSGLARKERLWLIVKFERVCGRR